MLAIDALRRISRHRKRAMIGFASIVGITGCSLGACVPTASFDARAPAFMARTAVLSCDSGQSITVTCEGSSAYLESNAGSVRLQQQRVASGIHYAGSGHDLRGKGPEIMWTDPSGTIHNCRDRTLGG